MDDEIEKLRRLRTRLMDLQAAGQQSSPLEETTP